jgi:hypothetical protein
MNIYKKKRLKLNTSIQIQAQIITSNKYLGIFYLFKLNLTFRSFFAELNFFCKEVGRSKGF